MNSDTGQVLSILSTCSECGISVYILMLILYLFVVVLMKNLNLSKLPASEFQIHVHCCVVKKEKKKRLCFKHWIVTRIHSALMCCDSNVALHFEYGNCVSVHSGQC